MNATHNSPALGRESPGLSGRDVTAVSAALYTMPVVYWGLILEQRSGARNRWAAEQSAAELRNRSVGKTIVIAIILFRTSDLVFCRNFGDSIVADDGLLQSSGPQARAGALAEMCGMSMQARVRLY